MAESFATTLYGEGVLGYYVAEVQGDDLQSAKSAIGAALDVQGFNEVRGYIFGNAMAAQFGYTPAPGVPAFGGYAVGYGVVQAYLQRTGTPIEEATFLPADVIVRESGYFT